MGGKIAPTDSPHYRPHGKNCQKQAWMTKNYQKQEKDRQGMDKNGHPQEEGDQNFQSRGGEI